MALREHFRVDDSGAIGYIGMPPSERRLFAAQSRKDECSKCGYKARELVGAAPLIPVEVETRTKTAVPDTPKEQNGGSWWMLYLIMAILAFIIAAVIIADP